MIFSTIATLLLLYLGIYVVVRPQAVGRAERRIYCRLRLLRAERVDIPPGKFALFIYRCCGIFLIYLALADLSQLRFTSSAMAQTEPVILSPGTTGMHAVGDIVTTHALTFMKTDKPVGLAIAVMDSDTTSIQCYGETRLGSRRIPDGETIFEIGSITKTFTSTFLADLVCRGAVELDQPVGELINSPMPGNGGEAITLQHLGTHTSGLPRLPSNLIWSMFIPGRRDNPYRSYTPEDLKNFLRKYNLKSEPGKDPEYSNVGSGLLGYALTQATSSTYGNLLRTIITQPLVMPDTVITLSPDQLSRIATGYTGPSSLPGVRLYEEAKAWDFTDALAGGGAIRSTPKDMLKYLAANLDTTTGPLAAALELCHQPRAKMDAQTTIGLGWVQTKNFYLHDGGTGGFSSVMIFSKPHKVGLVILCNTSNENIMSLGINIIKAIISARSRNSVR